jgi:hypothetical protein
MPAGISFLLGCIPVEKTYLCTVVIDLDNLTITLKKTDPIEVKPRNKCHAGG